MPITLRTDFAGGNGLLLSVDESGDVPAVRFAAEPRNCPQALWFHFLLSGLGGRPARLILANPEQTLGGVDWSGDRLVVRRPGLPWTRTDLPQRIDAAGGRIEWAWKVGPATPGSAVTSDDADEYEVAVCFPYQPADLAETLAALGGAEVSKPRSSRFGGHPAAPRRGGDPGASFESTTIGLTLGGRSIPRVFNALAETSRPGVFLTSRHHAGETPGTWVLDGLLRHVAGRRDLREALSWWLVPFVNLDDVVTGSYGKDPYPHDCNRAYGPGGPKRPEVMAVMADARRLKHRSARMLFIDVHAPGHAEQACYVPLRGWDHESPLNPIGREFAERFQAACPRQIRSPKAHITPEPGESVYLGVGSRAWAQTVLGVEAISLEISYQGNGKTAYDVADYRRLGAALAETAARWLLEGAAPR